MPNSAYRRKLRSTITTLPICIIQPYTNTTIVPKEPSKEPPILPPIVKIQPGECDIDKIRNYFYKVIDMIIEHSNFTDTAVILNDIIHSVHTKVEYYKILDVIEHKLLSTVNNITENVNPKIIKVRIDYIKTYIDKLPPLCGEPGPISKMILELINSIIECVNFEKVTDTIHTIHTYIEDTYGTCETFEKIELIQKSLTSIVENIGNGVTSQIINMRVKYVKDILIDC